MTSAQPTDFLGAEDPAPTDVEEITVHDEEATREAGRRLGARLGPRSFVGLDGPLGAGKTVFAQGVALGLGVPPDVRVASPTYAYVHEYRQGRLPLIHMDLYRLETLDDLEAIGYREMYDSPGVCVVEWSQRVPEALPCQRTEVRIEALPGSGGRKLFIRVFAG